MYCHQSHKRDQLPSSVHNIQSSLGRVAILDTSFLQPFKNSAVQFRLLAYQSAFTKTHSMTSANTIHLQSFWLKQHSIHLIVTFPCTICLESIKLHINFDHCTCFEELLAFLVFLSFWLTPTLIRSEIITFGLALEASMALLRPIAMTAHDSFFICLVQINNCLILRLHNINCPQTPIKFSNSSQNKI